MQDYNITFHPQTKMITNVTNRSYGEIKFKAIKIDESSGYVIGSELKLWTSCLSKDVLNIVHIHLNDTSDEASVDVKYLVSDKELDAINKGDFSAEQFKKDLNGIPLRYKILIHNMRVKQVLYNTGSSIETVKHREYRIQAMQSPGEVIEESKDEASLS